MLRAGKGFPGLGCVPADPLLLLPLLGRVKERNKGEKKNQIYTLSGSAFLREETQGSLREEANFRLLNHLWVHCSGVILMMNWGITAVGVLETQLETGTHNSPPVSTNS